MKLLGRLPKGNRDGLSPVEPQVTKHRVSVVAVVILEPARIAEDVDTGQQEATLRVRSIEAITTDADALTARELMRRAFEDRTGAVTLPIDDDDLDVDPATGEVID